MGDQTTATFDNRDRMRTQGQEVFTYNKNGELTARENTQTGKTAAYSYDTFGNMTGATAEDGQQITYKLDADANRATREVDGQVQARFIYAPGIQGPVAELAGDNTLRARYVYASRSNVPDYMVRGGNTYRLLTDQLGSVRMVVDASSGHVAQEIEYDPFGSITRDTNEGFQPFGFAGGLYDPATGLTHFGAREYDAGMGRWTAGDPIGFSGRDSNLYGYVIGDPVNLIDPMGTDWIDAVGQRIMGFGDGLTFGITERIRNGIGLGHVVDKCSTDYRGSHLAGRITGAVSAGVTAGAGVAALPLSGMASSAASGATAGAVETIAFNGRRTTANGLATGTAVGLFGGGVANGFVTAARKFAGRDISRREAAISAGAAFGTGATLFGYSEPGCGC